MLRINPSFTIEGCRSTRGSECPVPLDRVQKGPDIGHMPHTGRSRSLLTSPLGPPTEPWVAWASHKAEAGSPSRHP